MFFGRCLCVWNLDGKLAQPSLWGLSVIQLPFLAHLGRSRWNSRDAGRDEVEAVLFLKEDKNANKERKLLLFLHLINRGRSMTVPWACPGAAQPLLFYRGVFLCALNRLVWNIHQMTHDIISIQHLTCITIHHCTTQPCPDLTADLKHPGYTGRKSPRPISVSALEGTTDFYFFK